MSNLWWLQPGWKQTLCADCGVNIWDSGGDPDHGVCYECFNRRWEQGECYKQREDVANNLAYIVTTIGNWEMKREKERELLAHDAALRARVEELEHENKNLITCECDGCENLLEQDAYCLNCYRKSQALLENEKDNKFAAYRVIDALTAELAQVKKELAEAKCGEALCGHDHSNQYWELRSNKAEQSVIDLQRELAQVKGERDRLANPIEHADYFSHITMDLELKLTAVRAREGRLREALTWVLNLHHGVSKNAGDGFHHGITNEEWEAALIEAHAALQEAQ